MVALKIIIYCRVFKANLVFHQLANQPVMGFIYEFIIAIIS